MKRTVNGHYADENSTRNIEDIPKVHFATLVDVLREQAASISYVIQQSDQEVMKILQTSFDFVNNNKTITITDANDYKFTLSLRLQYIMDMLEVINAPYEGAQYQTPDGETIIPNTTKN